MDKDEFIRKLFILFPPERNYQETVEIYSEALDDGRNYNYQKLFKKIIKDYKYKTAPAVSYILEKLPLVEIRQIPLNSGLEGEVVKKIINGHEYEFTIVNNDWKCPTIKDLEKKIK